MRFLLVMLLMLVAFNLHAAERYFVTMQIKQSHFTLDPFEHAKDAMNAIKMDIPVDKKFYDAVQVGTILNNDFRGGSFLINGSLGNWKISVVNKRIVNE